MSLDWNSHLVAAFLLLVGIASLIFALKSIDRK